MSQIASSALSWMLSSMAPRRSMSGRASSAYDWAASTSPCWVARTDSWAVSIDRVHGPSSSSQSDRPSWAARNAPAMSPEFSRAWLAH